MARNLMTHFAPLPGVLADPNVPTAGKLIVAVPLAAAEFLGNKIRGMYDAATVPGDVYAGRADPLSPEGFDRVQNLGGMIGLGGLGSKIGELSNSYVDVLPSEMLASKVVPGYNPPARNPRPFEADYPAGAEIDEAGNLTKDIEGRPLGAQFIAGRRSLGADVAISPFDTRLVGAGAGGTYKTNSPRDLRGTAGRLVRGPVSETDRPGYRISLNSSLTDAQLNRTAAHETGHLIDELAGRIPTNGLSRELSSVYNDLNNPQSYGKTFGPKQAGYKGDEVSREYMAEAIRAYMTDPNYLKTVAPRTAARIREYVNNNARLKNTIQFNAGSVPITLTPVDHDPFSNDGPELIPVDHDPFAE